MYVCKQHAACLSDIFISGHNDRRAQSICIEENRLTGYCSAWQVLLLRISIVAMLRQAHLICVLRRSLSFVVFSVVSSAIFSRAPNVLRTTFSYFQMTPILTTFFFISNYSLCYNWMYCIHVLPHFPTADRILWPTVTVLGRGSNGPRASHRCLLVSSGILDEF